MLCQCSDQLESIQCLHPVERNSCLLRFVGLQVADEMPFQPESAQCLDFRQGFLYVIFAKRLLATSRHGGNRCS